jgi:malonyl-CoA/methylmalonyl-CoA synthetase
VTNHLYGEVRAARASGDTAFIRTPDGRIIRHADLDALTGRLANALLGLGVSPGDRVAVQVEKSPEALLLYLACVRAGAVFLPLNTAYTIPEVEFFVRDAEPRLVVVSPERAAGVVSMAAAVGATIATLDEKGGGSLAEAASRASPDFADASRAPDDLAAILYTSGTTGRSKGAMLTHENLASNARTLVEAWRFGPSDVLLHALPVFHTHGLFVATNTALFSGSGMILLPRFDADAILRHLPAATVLMGVPTFYVRLLRHPALSREAAAHMRLFVSGSAPLLAETHRTWRERTGHAILERYGMTETNMNTSNPYDGERVAGTVGRPLPGVELRIVDPETTLPMQQGDVGMIEVRGPNVFSGYWRLPEKTRTEFRPDGFFITGDLGRIEEHGYVEIVGRGKDLIISGGFNVYPKEVEEAIDAIAGVAESAVIGVPHPDLGGGVTAIVTLRDGATIDEPAILRDLSARLAAYKRPKRVIFVDELPRNTMGKVQKALLRERYAALYAD